MSGASYDIGARTIEGEAGHEPEAGQRAIAHIIVNRVRAKRWGESILSVCLWPWQFSCWNPSDPNRKRLLLLPDDYALLATYAQMLVDAETDPDPTNGALYYKVSSLPWPKDWGPRVDPIYSVGHHSFYILKENGA